MTEFWEPGSADSAFGFVDWPDYAKASRPANDDAYWKSKPDADNKKQ